MRLRNPYVCGLLLTMALDAACSPPERQPDRSPPGQQPDPGAPPARAPSDPVQPPAALPADFESELNLCISEINRYRATLGLPALTRSSALDGYATAGAREDGLAHVAHRHFRATDGGGIALAENEIPWWSSPSVRTVIQQGLAMMWAEGPGGPHYENMRGPYTEVGCGVFVNGNEITVVQAFR